MKNYKTIISLIVIISFIIVLLVILKYIIKRIKLAKEKNIEKKFKKLDLSKNIQLINNKYNIEPLEIFYDQY